MAKRAAAFERMASLEKAANEAAAGQAGAPAVAGSTKALVPGLVKKSKLAPLVAEQSAGAPLHGTTSNLWWQATWSAPYLPGEEGALMLLKVLGTKEADAKEAPLVGWVALPLEGMGEQHLQLHAPPLPLSAAEARAPKTDASRRGSTATSPSASPASPPSPMPSAPTGARRPPGHCPSPSAAPPT